MTAGLNTEPVAPAAPASGRSLWAALSYPGWTMVLIGFIAVMFAFAAPVVTMPLIYGRVMREFGWSRTDATLIFTYKYMASSVVALFVVGPMLDRFGLRVVMTMCCLTTAAGMISFLWVNSLWSYYFAGFLFGLGGTTVLIPIKVLISRWFNRNLGLAIAIAVTGTSAGGFVFPLFENWLIAQVGWRLALASLSLGILGIALPLYLLKANDSPSEADVLPEALNPKAKVETIAAARSGGAAEPVEFRTLLRTRMFWCITVSLFIVGAIDGGLLQHLILFVHGTVGFSREVAAQCLSAVFLLGLFAKFVAGRVYDLLSIRGVQLWYSLLGLTAASALLVHGYPALAVFTLLLGIAHGGLVSDIPVLAKHCYGPRYMNKALSVFTGFFGLGAAVGPLALSIVYDHTDSYYLGFWIFFALSLLSAGLMQGVRPLYRQRMMQEG